jgi:hypothetical protein
LNFEVTETLIVKIVVMNPRLAVKSNVRAIISSATILNAFSNLGFVTRRTIAAIIQMKIKDTRADQLITNAQVVNGCALILLIDVFQRIKYVMENSTVLMVQMKGRVVI